MNASGQVLLASAIAIVILMVSTWLLSVKLKDASIVDIVWGLGFVVVAWTVRLVADGNSGRGWLLTILTTVWGLRLATYLLWRNHGKGEDYRYRAMRKHYGKRFAMVSLVTVFGLQGTLMWIVSLPVQLGQVRSTPSLGVVGIIGAVVWAIGLAFESIGDAQLVRFKADSANAGKVMDKGLWRYTRHPNYFGDACVWWGLAIVAAETRLGLFGLIGAATMTLFLRRVSGVTLLERSLVKRRAGYTEYVARTSPFVPRPPRKIPAG
jgi:steroid 5-alpha reductase family enzyme